MTLPPPPPPPTHNRRWRAAGVLPLANHPRSGEPLVLLGREWRRRPRGRHGYVWSDFGGSQSSRDACVEDTAAREWAEETMGVWGRETTSTDGDDGVPTQRDVDRAHAAMVKRLASSATSTCFASRGYSMFVARVPFVRLEGCGSAVIAHRRPHNQKQVPSETFARVHAANRTVPQATVSRHVEKSSYAWVTPYQLLAAARHPRRTTEPLDAPLFAPMAALVLGDDDGAAFCAAVGVEFGGDGDDGGSDDLAAAASTSSPSPPPATTTTRPIIFLDVDGVLNDSRTLVVSDTHLARLVRIVRATQARVVVSSSWRRMASRRRALTRTLSDAGIDVVGYTPTTAVVTTPGYAPERRAREIRAWLADNGAGDVRWLAIDDMVLTPVVPSAALVCTDAFVGLTDADVADAIERLIGERD